jgi:hypothetical protein
MVAVEQYSPSYYQDVITLLKRFDSDVMTPPVWNILLKRASAEGSPIGWVLRDENAVVGFIGTIYSHQIIEGQLKKFCNLTSWIVLDEYRNQALSLLTTAIADKNSIYTDLTASPEAHKILKAFRFKEFETHAAVYVSEALSDYKCSAVSLSNLSEDFLSVLNGHADSKLKLAQLGNDDKKCIIAYTLTDLHLDCLPQATFANKSRVIGKGVQPLAHIHWVSDFRSFFNYRDDFVSYLRASEEAVGLFIEKRFVPAELAGQFRWGQLPIPRFYRGDVKDITSITTLHSELSLLGVSGQSHLVYGLSRVQTLVEKILDVLRVVIKYQATSIDRLDKAISAGKSAPQLKADQ